MKKSQVKQSSLWPAAVVLIVLCVISFSVYFNTLQHCFVWDDTALIADNHYIKKIENLPLFFTPCYWNTLHPVSGKNYYRPVRTATFAVDYFVWESNPFGYHLTNLLLHLMNVMMVFFLISQLSGDDMFSPGIKSRFSSLPFFTAVLFALHPVHTETVVYVKNRSDLLAFLFLILSFCFFIKTIRQDKGENTIILYLSALFCFLLALLSKESALIFPVILIGYGECFFSEARRSKIRLRVLPFAGMALLYFLFMQVFIKTTTSPPAEALLPFWRHSLIIWKTLGYYFHLLLFPVNFNVDYFFTIPATFGVSAVFFPVAAMLALCLAIIVSYRKKKLLCFGIGWALLTLLPVSNIIYLSSRPIAEQRLYFPSLGICLLLALGLRGILSGGAAANPRKSFVAGSVVAAVFIFYSTQTVRRNHDWRSDLSLWQDCIRKSPLKARAYNNLGNAYDEKKDYATAIKYLRQALELRRHRLGETHPVTGATYNSLGVVYRHKQDYDSAACYFQKAMETSLQNPHPDYLLVASAYNGLGAACGDRGENRCAVEYYRKALAIRQERLGPDHPDTGVIYSNLGGAYDTAGDYQKAVGCFQKALDIKRKTFGANDPAVAEACNDLAHTYKNAGDWGRATSYYQEALDILKLSGNDPVRVAEIYNSLGGVFLRCGEYVQAEVFYRQALQLNRRRFGDENQSVVLGYNNLAGVYVAQGDYDKAIDYMQTALRAARSIPLDTALMNTLQQNRNNLVGAK